MIGSAITLAFFFYCLLVLAYVLINKFNPKFDILRYITKREYKNQDYDLMLRTILDMEKNNISKDQIFKLLFQDGWNPNYIEKAKKQMEALDYGSKRTDQREIKEETKRKLGESATNDRGTSPTDLQPKSSSAPRSRNIQSRAVTTFSQFWRSAISKIRRNKKIK